MKTTNQPKTTIPMTVRVDARDLLVVADFLICQTGATNVTKQKLVSMAIGLAALQIEETFGDKAEREETVKGAVNKLKTKYNIDLTK